MDFFDSIDCNKICVNNCLTKSRVFRKTIFAVDQLGRSDFSIPYIDGSLSIK